MIRLLPLVGFTLLLLARANAQAPIEVVYEKDNAGAYAFSCRNSGFCPYTLTVTFTQLMGLRSSTTLPFQTEVRPASPVQAPAPTQSSHLVSLYVQFHQRL